MKYIKLIKQEYGFTLDEYEGQDIWVLAIFLKDMQANITHFKEFAEDKYEEIDTNLTELTKKDDKILIRYYPCSCHNEEPEDIFEISKDQFLKLLDEWEKLYKKSPNEIIVTYENGIINLEGKN